MNKPNDSQIKNLLKQSIGPTSQVLERDLWPQMLRRLDAQTPGRAVPWFDWALLLVVVVSILAFPHSILLLLYHL